MGIFKFNKNTPVTFVSQEAEKIYCRTFFCPKCAEKHRPYRGLRCILFGSRRQAYFRHTVSRTLVQYPSGLTPHLISVINDGRKNPDIHGYVGISVCCSIVGCGTIVYEVNKELKFNRIQSEIREYWLPVSEVRALLKQVGGFGYRI